MALNLKNVTIANCGTGISAPADATINADGLQIFRTALAIELRDPPGLMQRLGLPPNTPPDLVIEALALLKQSEAPVPQKFEALKESRLTKFVEGTGVVANLATIGQALLPLLAMGG